MRIQLLIIFAICQYCISLNGQINYPGKPIGCINDYPVSFIKINQSQSSDIVTQNKYKITQFAHVAKVDFNPIQHGQWYEVSKSLKIWKLGICSPGSTSIGLTFTKFRLLPGVKLFVYACGNSDFLGAYTFRNNNKVDVLSIAPVFSDSIIVEMQVPAQINDFGQIQIGQIGIGYQFIHSQVDKLKSNSETDECYVDVSCYINRELQIQKNSVCKIIFNNSGICTGTLINNTSFNNRQLVLTSAHCVKDNEVAQTSIFFFDYEKELCNGYIKPLKSVSGSRLLARNEDLDFTLLEVQEKIPFDYKPVFSGWDITGEPFAKSYTIEHPLGKEKKVAVNEDMVLDGRRFNIDNDYYWVIPDYEAGTTNAGSSGSALLDSAFHVRGILSFGGESCAPTIYDYYIRLDQAWNSSPDSIQQLAYWLDPLNTGTKKLASFHPNPFLSYAQTISNIRPTDTLVSELYYDNGYIAGTNPLKIKSFAEHYTINGSKYIYGIVLHTNRVYTNSNQTKVNIIIWSGKNKPEKVIYKQPLLLFELASDAENLIRFDSMKLVTESFFAGIELENIQADDTFSLYYTNLLNKNRAWVYFMNRWSPMYSGDKYLNASFDIKVLAFDYYINEKNKPGQFPYDKIVNIYPNPVTDHFQVLFNQAPTQKVIVKVYDLLGKLKMQYIYTNVSQNFRVETGNIVPGLYIVNVDCEWGTFNEKILITSY